jgi:hypothetical protein
MRSIPRPISALIRALQFDGADPGELTALNHSAWSDLLLLSDGMHLTLPLLRIHGDVLPGWVRSRLAQNLADNSARFERIRSVYSEIAEHLHGLALDHIVLKGFAQCPSFVDDPRYRMQSDLDLFCPADQISHARDALAALGYEPLLGLNPPGAEHLPPMRRKTSWVWGGNSFDPEMPLSVELHFRFWNEAISGSHPAGLQQFWLRRNEHRIENFRFPSLCKVDSLAYSALHVFRHLQIGALLPSHVYEIAYFLHHHGNDVDFWKQWRELHHASLRQIQATCFRLANHWFACALPEEAAAEIALLPKGVEQWFKQFADSPLRSVIRPNKDPLWLHFSLVNSWKDRVSLLRHGLFPGRTLGPGSAQTRSLRTLITFLIHLGSRFTYHTRILIPTLWHGIGWWLATKRSADNL